MSDDVLLTVHNGLGRITLNRPRTINALTHAMCVKIDAALRDWANAADVRAVVIDGAGERGLCAGGDIRGMHADAVAGGSASIDFWADEYRLNALIARYPKPYVAIMDGLVMGGGVGVSAHGDLRVVTERSRIGMPEVGIGLVPDVGGTYLLSRLPGELGTHIALTAGQISGSDAVHCGLADHFVPSGSLPALLGALADGEPADVLTEFAETPPRSQLAEDREWIDASYTGDSLAAILDRLREHGEPGTAAAKEIEGKSPTALKVTLGSLRSAAALPDLESVLRQEFRVSSRCLRHPDLAEGIRAQIIDKDRNPHWSPFELADITEAEVDAFFAPLPDGELRLDAAH